MTALLVLALAAAPARAQVRNPDAFVYAVVGEVDSLDPHWQYDGVSHFAVDHVYEGLVEYAGARTDAFEPALAERVPTKANGLVSSDGRTYTFPIRKGVRFHDGSTLTPEDARYSLLRGMLMDRDGGSSWLLLDAVLGVSSVRGPDGKPRADLYARAAKAVRVEGGSVKVTLHKPFAPFLSLLANYCYVVSKPWTVARGGWSGGEADWAARVNPPKEAVEMYKEGNGTGPFRVERWDRTGRQLVLARHDAYRRAPAALARVVVRTVPEFATRKLLLQNGDADAVLADRSLLPQLEGLPGVTVTDGLPYLEVHNAFLFGLRLNTAGNPLTGSGRLDGRGIPADFFADRDVRLGFAKAFPRARYIADVYRGKGAPAVGPIPPGVLGHDPQAPPLAEDPAAAEAHLKKAHGGRVWENGFTLSCVFQQGRDTRGQACGILKSVLERMNPKFRVDVRPLQWSTLLDLQNSGKLPLACARWGLDYPDPHNGVHPFLHSQGTYAKAQGYANPEADRLIAEAAAAQDPAVRRRLYRRLLDLAREDAPSFFTLDTYDFRVTRSWVKGFGHNPMKPYGLLYGVSKG